MPAARLLLPPLPRRLRAMAPGGRLPLTSPSPSRPPGRHPLLASYSCAHIQYLSENKAKTENWRRAAALLAGSTWAARGVGRPAQSPHARPPAAGAAARPHCRRGPAPALPTPRHPLRKGQLVRKASADADVAGRGALPLSGRRRRTPQAAAARTGAPRAVGAGPRGTPVRRRRPLAGAVAGNLRALVRRGVLPGLWPIVGLCAAGGV